ncbi:VPS51 [Cordylochernes scorpioides]|uniref:Vacuolar protein sorting-associated protein 51 homolog n=1 Tax=Cordylochernes scorpioides TaxID=51811 RepID=A0ABY6KIQ7_9ARAC|nr:VPS51 [Cordylochernes scorpioides]
MAENHIGNENPTDIVGSRSLINDRLNLSMPAMDILDPYDINCQDFNVDMYLTKMLNKTPLSDLIVMEKEYFKQIQTLDGEMQTLVYENYNKFIKASETIRQMKFDLEKMEQDMLVLQDKMGSIKHSSTNVYSTFKDNRQQITNLSGIHTTLQKLQFLFSLPKRLELALERGNYIQAVKTYTKSQKVLDQYLSMASFQGIQKDVNIIMDNLKVILKEGLQSKHITATKLTEYVDLLLQLGEPAEQLCDEFISQGVAKLNEDLAELKLHIEKQDTQDNIVNEDNPVSAPDILEFVDLGCNKFLSNLSLFYNCFQELFVNRSPNPGEKEAALTAKLNEFIKTVMNEYFDLFEKRIKVESGYGDNTLLVRALDRFYRRLQAGNKILKNNEFIEQAETIVMSTVKSKCQQCYTTLLQHLNSCITDTRHSLAVPEPEDLNKLLDQLENSVLDHLKITLHSLQTFIQPEVTFSLKPQFYENFTHSMVREGIVVAFFRHVHSLSTELTASMEVASPALLLVLAKLCLNFDSYAVSRMLLLVDEAFLIDDLSKLTSTPSLCAEAKVAAQRFLDHFVKVQGLGISQMVRKSMEGRDWMKCMEPTNVRAVMKRMVEELTSMDAVVGQLFEEGQRRDRSSDSSRRTFPYSSSSRLNRSSWSIGAPNNFDSNLLSNIQKLFVERIEIFGSVEFTKISVMTGIIKISLKTFLECVRHQTFTKYGVQQIQIDTHYLHLYLWRFVTDENVIHVLLDEVVGSTIHRCLDPQLLEPHLVEAICDRN